MNRTRRAVAVAVAVAALALTITACGSSYNDKRGTGDAPVASFADEGWDIQNAPDGFGNVATRCSSYVDGIRLWVVTHRATDVQPVVTKDETCHATKGR